MMHIAVMNEDYAFLRFLLANFPNLMEEIDKDYNTPLSLSIELEKYFCSKILIQAKSNPNTGGGNKYKSNLIISILKMQFYLVLDLIKNGADVHYQDDFGNTPFHYLLGHFDRDPK